MSVTPEYPTCATCKFFTAFKSGPQEGMGFCRGGPISQMPIKQANEFGSTHQRPIYASGEPACVMHSPVVWPNMVNCVTAAEMRNSEAENATALSAIAKMSKKTTVERDEAQAEVRRLLGLFGRARAAWLKHNGRCEHAASMVAMGAPIFAAIGGKEQDPTEGDALQAEIDRLRYIASTALTNCGMDGTMEAEMCEALSAIATAPTMRDASDGKDDAMNGRR